MGSLYLGGPTIQEVDGKMMMGLSIYGVAVISGSLYSRFYGRLDDTTSFKFWMLPSEIAFLQFNFQSDCSGGVSRWLTY